MEGLISFVLAGLALTGSPGPATLGLAATGAAFGARRGLPFLLGIAAGMVVVIGLTATGMTGVLLAVPGAAPIITTMAAAYIIYLAYRIATTPPLAKDAGQRPRPSFAGGVLLALVNPKAYAAMAAMFSGFVLIDGRPGLDAVAKTIVLMVIILIVDIAWLSAGSALTRVFGDPRASRVINLAFAVLLVASVVFALLL